MTSDVSAIPAPKQARAEGTVQQLIDATIEAIETKGEAGVRIDDLLETTGITRGSLYHFFGDRDGLIVAAMAQQFGRLVDDDLDQIEQLSASASSASDMLSLLSGLTDVVQSPERANRRLTRAAIVGASANRPLLAHALAGEQHRLTTRLTQFVQQLQELGWARKDLSAHAIAVFVLAFTFGRVLSDIDAEPVDGTEWVQLIGAVVEGTLFAG